MQYATLAALFFASAAVAAPAPEPTATSTSDSYDDYDDYSDSYGLGGEVPSSISSIVMAIESAVPTEWLMSMYTHSGFANAEASRIANGDFPDWVSDVPEVAQTYFEEELQGEASTYLSYIATATDDLFATATDDASSSATDIVGSGLRSIATSLVVQTTIGSSSSHSAASTTEASTSGSASGSASPTSEATSTSTAGAPAATGGIAMSLAGAAGVLGLALAL
ncbi:hypothetical protein N7532_006396 [Penicillium argentinense]|uniref:Uncharacterized protein n=1 Tax=Penicillium argentinense TaxID=1131581 RepID=A0A9W9FFQ7_9EURO|nr:uncharacterized protein N7532_006396 [Penicillium argentinense]KAJ5099395.1 hypothetical protein N7532_006396 [Penicillium argentinense]